MGDGADSKPAKKATDVFEDAIGSDKKDEPVQRDDVKKEETSKITGDTSEKSATEKLLDDTNPDDKQPSKTEDKSEEKAGEKATEKPEEKKSGTDLLREQADKEAREELLKKQEAERKRKLEEAKSGDPNKGEIKFDLSPDPKENKTPEKTEEKPPVKEEDKPPVKEEDKPPVKEEDKPPVKEEDKPPVKDEEKEVERTDDKTTEKPEGSDKPAETLLEIIKDAENVQAKLKLINHHMDNAGERILERKKLEKDAEGKNLSPAEKQQYDQKRRALLQQSLDKFELAAGVVTPQEAKIAEKQREVIEKAIEEENSKADKDFDKLRALKKIERNLQLLQRSPGFTRGNAALALYEAGETKPDPEIGKNSPAHALFVKDFEEFSPAQAMLIKAFAADKTLRHGKDPNFFRRATEIESKALNKDGTYLGIQKDANLISLKMRELELVGFKPDKEEDKPPVKEEDKPPVKEEDKPPVKEEDKPPVKEEDKPPVKEEDKPPVKEEDKPPVKEEDKPPVKEEDKPPVKEEDKPPVKEEDKPPAKAVEKGPEEYEKKIELPTLEASPLKDGKSPLEVADAAVREYIRLRNEGKSPKESFTPEVKAAIENAITDADKGITPRAEILDKQVREKIQAVKVLPDTKLGEIVWNPSAENEADRTKLPPALKAEGNENLTYRDARKIVEGQFNLIIEKQPVEQQRVMAHHLNALNNSKTAREYNQNAEALKKAFDADPKLKEVYNDPSFTQLREAHVQLAEPMIRANESLYRTENDYKREYNQRTATRMLAGSLYGDMYNFYNPENPANKNNPDAPKIDPNELATFKSKEQSYFKDAYATNIVEDASAEVIKSAYSAGVKPLELFKTGLDRVDQKAKGEKNMGINLPMLAKDLSLLYKLEAGDQSGADSETITPEGFKKAAIAFKESGLFERMIKTADEAKVPEGNERFLARYRYGDILAVGGQTEEGVNMLKEAYTHTDNLPEAQAAFNRMLEITKDPEGMLKFALDQHQKVLDGGKPAGLPLHVIARNAPDLYAIEASKHIKEGQDQPDEEAKKKALETLKPLFDRMVTQADSSKISTFDEKYSTRRVYGEILLEAKDPGAKDMLSQAYARAIDMNEAIATSGLAALAGAKPNELLKGLIDNYEKTSQGKKDGSVDKSERMLPPEALVILSGRSLDLMKDTLDGKLDGKVGDVAIENATITTDMLNQIHVSNKENMERISKILGDNFEVAESNYKAMNTEFESLLPKDEAERKEFLELHNKLFNPEMKKDTLNISRADALANIPGLLRGGEVEQEGRKWLTENKLDGWLKDYDRWVELGGGDKEALQKLVLIEGRKPIELEAYKNATQLRFDFKHMHTTLEHQVGERDAAKQRFTIAIAEIPDQFKKEMIEDNTELHRFIEIVTDERIIPDFTKMNTADLQKHVNFLTKQPSSVIMKVGTDPATGQPILKEAPLQPDTDPKSVELYGIGTIDATDQSKYQLEYNGRFDYEKARENLAEYKAAMAELIKRSDNPQNTEGEPITREQLKKYTKLRLDSLEAGVDYTQPANEKGEYPALDKNRRMELHIQTVSQLKTLAGPVFTRMEYAMRMESLGQRKDASEAYQEALKIIPDIPRDMIQRAKLLASKDSAAFGEEKVNVFNEVVRHPNGQPVLDDITGKPIPLEKDAATEFARLNAYLIGNPSVGDDVIDRSTSGTDGKTYLYDPSKLNASSMDLLYGLDSVHTVLGKRATLFYLAPKFEQTEKHLGTKQYIDLRLVEDTSGRKSWQPIPDSSDPTGFRSVSKDKLVEGAPVRPHGAWTYGNTNAFKPDAALDAVKHSIAVDREINLGEAEGLTQKDKEMVAKSLRYLLELEPKEDQNLAQYRDAEMGQIYKSALANGDPVLTRGIRNDFGANLTADALAVLAAGVTFTLVTKKAWPARKMTNTAAMARAATILTTTTAAAGATRYGTMRFLTGDDGTFSDHAWHTVGTVGVAIVGSKMLNNKFSGTALRILPEENAVDMFARIGKLPGVKPVQGFASGIRHSLDKPIQVIANLKDNFKLVLDDAFGKADDVPTLGHLMSGISEDAAKGIKKAVDLTDAQKVLPLASDEAQAILKASGLSKGVNPLTPYGLTRKAFQELGDNPTLDDLQRALGNAGKPNRLYTLKNLEPDDLLKKITHPMVQDIIERAGYVGSGYTPLARELAKVAQQAKNGELTNLVAMADDMGARLEIDNIAQILDDNLKIPYSGKPPTVRNMMNYLESTGAFGKSMAKKIDDLAKATGDAAKVLDQPISSATGKGIIESIDLHKNIAKLAGESSSKAAYEAADQFTTRLRDSVARAAGKEADEVTVTVADLQKHLIDKGQAKLASKLGSGNLDAALTSKEGLDILRSANLHHAPGILDEPVDTILQSMRRGADKLNPEDVTMGQLKERLKQNGHSSLARKISDDMADIKLSDPLAREIIENTKLHHNPKLFAKASDDIAAQADLADDIAKKFGDDYKPPTLQRLYDDFRKNFDGLSDARYEEAFYKHFPNLKDVPRTTALKDLYKLHLKALDGGEGIHLLIRDMAPEMAKKVNPALANKFHKAALQHGQSSFWRTSGETAWSGIKGTYRAGRHPIKTGEEVVGAVKHTLDDPIARGKMLNNLASMRRVTGEKIGGAITGTGKAIGKPLKWAWDNIKIHRLTEASDWATINKAGNANAIHSYWAMKGTWGATVGAHELRENELNPATGKPYTFTESLVAATVPDMIGSTDQGFGTFAKETGLKTTGTLGRFAFESFIGAAVLRGGLPARMWKEPGGKGMWRGAWSGVNNSFQLPYNAFRNLNYYSSGTSLLAQSTRPLAAYSALSLVDVGYTVPFTVMENAINRGELKVTKRIGPSDFEKRDQMGEPISNDPYYKPPTWEERYKAAAETMQKAKEEKDNVTSVPAEKETTVVETKPPKEEKKPVVEDKGPDIDIDVDRKGRFRER